MGILRHRDVDIFSYILDLRLLLCVLDLAAETQIPILHLRPCLKIFLWLQRTDDVDIACESQKASEWEQKEWRDKNAIIIMISRVVS